MKQTWQVFDARRGEAGPWHVYRGRTSDGRKLMEWWADQRTPGLRDHQLADLVYLPVGLALVRATELVVVTEGEKSADAVAATGLRAAATVCGAAGTPGPSVGELFRGRAVVLWPDADPVGRDHMGRVGRLLETHEVGWVYVVRPPADVPAGWDAADTDPAGIVRLVAAAEQRGPIGPRARVAA